MATFWGLTMDGANKVYTQVVKQTFHVSMVSLQPGSGSSDPVSVYARVQDTDFLLCTLKDGRIPQQPVDLNFGAGDTISFYISKPGVVHLTGYVDTEEGMEDMESDDEDEVPDLVDSKSNKDLKRILAAMNGPQQKRGRIEEESDEEEFEEEDDDDEDDEDDEDEDEEESEEEPSPARKKQDIRPKPSTTVIKPAQQKSSDTPKIKTPKTEEKQKKKSESPAVTPAKPKTTTPANKPKATPKQRLKGGVVSEDTKVGHGPVAESGKMVSVYYRGTLEKNGKQFDSCLAGKPFKFKLGAGSVIRGWDIGVQGMKVGGRRHLNIPAQVAYGNKASGPIPPNSALNFEVELKAVH